MGILSVNLLVMLILMILIMKKMILILLFLSDFWLGMWNLKNAKQLKKDKWRINANSVASWKMVEFSQVRRWEERNRTDFYWRL